MNRISKIKTIVLFGVLIILILQSPSCNTWIDPDINEDPNKPTDISIDLLIPAIQVNMAYHLGGNNSVLPIGVFMQYFVEDLGSTLSHSYTSNYNTSKYLWQSIYHNGMDIQILIEKSSKITANGMPVSVYTRGMAKVMMAELIAFGTNLWNEIPYSEAFKAEEGILYPKPDTQEFIYTEVDRLLEEAITDLSAESSVLNIPNDLIFEGDKNMWLATAWALRARYSLILSKVDQDAYENAIIYANQAISNGFVGYVFKKYSSNLNNMNPLAQYMRERSGDLVMASTIINMLVADNDPRLSKFSAGNVGASIDAYGFSEGSLPGIYATAPNASTYHMNLAELYFILAESYLVTSEPDLAYSAFVEGVSASLTDVGVSGWPLNLPSDASSLTLEDIINQKYIANYATVQAFNDWRRTGFPVLAVPTGFGISEIPRRYLYPTDEVDLNKKISNDEITLFSRVWWDKI